MEPKQILFIVVCLVGIGIASFFIVREEPKKAKKRYTDRNPVLKKLSQIPFEEVIIIVDRDHLQRPIFQYILAFQDEMNGIKGECFTLLDAEQFELEEGKTYQLERASIEHEPFLNRIDMLITADGTMG